MIHIAVIFHPVFSVPAAVGEGPFLLFSTWQFFFLAAEVFVLYFPLISKVFLVECHILADFLQSQVLEYRWWIIELIRGDESSQSHYESKSDLLFHMTPVLLVVTLQLCVATLFFIFW